MKFCLSLLLLCLSIPAIAEPAPPPPCSAEPYRGFDFWEGNWTVRDANKQVVGENRVERILGGCALQENWRSSTGHQGKSLNFYDGRRGKWHQTWIDGTGGPLYLNGAVEAGKMVLGGTTPGKDGATNLHRITWTPLEDGRVKQHWEVSTDEGKTWKDAFVGFYEKNS